jgi:hypothetical protein
MKRKMTVVTDKNGKVLVTQVGHGDMRDPQSGLLVAVVAGPGQQIHKIEYDVPDVRSSSDIVEFHKKLGEHVATEQKKP